MSGEFGELFEKWWKGVWPVYSDADEQDAKYTSRVAARWAWRDRSARLDRALALLREIEFPVESQLYSAGMVGCLFCESHLYDERPVKHDPGCKLRALLEESDVQ